LIRIRQSQQQVAPSFDDVHKIVNEVLGLFDYYDVKPKPEEREESVGETFSKIHDEINRQLKFHGIFRSDTAIIIDPKQDKFVVVPRSEAKQFLTFLYSQAPLFCTHGKNELDCMKPNSPCKRRHQSECPIYLRITKFQELLEG